MQTIHPNTHVSTDVEFTERKVLLPGCNQLDRGLTKDQLTRVQTFASEMGLADTPWGTAAPQVRDHLNTNGRPDFVIVDEIFRIGFRKVASDPMSEKQMNTLLAILAVISGTDTHFDVGVQTRADQIPADVRARLQNRALDVQTKGQFSDFLRFWTAMTGKVTPRTTEDEREIPVEPNGQEVF